MNMTLLRKSLTTPQIDAINRRLDDSEHLLEQTLTEVRTVMADLRPAELDDFGLFKALMYFANSAGERAGFRVEGHDDDYDGTLSVGAKTTFYRIGQEAVTNVAKHARARCLTLRLHSDADDVTLLLEDDGCGLGQRAPDARFGRGLLGMRERAESLGASLVVEDRPTGGARVQLTMPRNLGKEPE